MTRWKYVMPVLMGIAAACSGTNQDGDSKESTGNLELALTARDNRGELYRLRNASFSIYGYPNYSFPESAGGEGGASTSGYYYSQVVSTETNPTAPVITQRVVPGTYYVSFDVSQPWYIEHVTAGGAERVARAVLLSNSYQYVAVYDRATTSVYYQFGIDGGVLDFRHGDLVIGISVERPDEGGSGGQPGFAGAPGL